MRVIVRVVYALPRFDTPGFVPVRTHRFAVVPNMHVAVADPVRMQGTGVRVPRDAVRKEGAANRLAGQGARQAAVHHDDGVVGVHAVVVPAVNGDRQRVRQLDARQLQVLLHFDLAEERMRSVLIAPPASCSDD